MCSGTWSCLCGKSMAGVDSSYSWCPMCGYWVPSKHMHYVYDETLKSEHMKGVVDGNIRICDNCLEATEQNPFPVFKPEPFQYDPHREDVQCIFCDSYSTKVTENGKYKCLDCGEEFYPFL